MIVVDHESPVVVWNRGSEQLGLRYDETIGNVLTTLDIGLPIDALEHPDRRHVRRSGRVRGRRRSTRSKMGGKHVSVRVTCRTHPVVAR